MILVATLFLHEFPGGLITVLIILSAVFVWLQWSRETLVIFLVVAFLGPLSEIAAIYFGAWIYTTPVLLGIPLWLPFLWGNAALSVLALKRFIDYRSQMRG